MKKILCILLILIGGCTSQTESLNEVTLMLDYTPNTNHTGIYVAKEKGYYENNGIKVNIVDSNSTQPIQALSNDIVDFGITYQEDLTLANSEGINNIKSIYAILSENTSGFVSYTDKNIISPEDFKGKTYCGWGSNVEQKIVEEVAKEKGVQAKDITIATTQTDFLRTPKDDCDFFWEYEGWSLVEATSQGIDYNYIPLKDLGYNYYSPIIVTNDKNIKENNDMVQSFINATIKGYEYTAQHPKEASQIFLKYNPTYDEELIMNSQKFLSNYYVGKNLKYGYQQENVWREFTNFLYETKIVKTNKYKELYTNEYIDEYYRS